MVGKRSAVIANVLRYYINGDKRKEFVMNFGKAIEAMKDGKKVSREGWNGKKMWIAIQKGSTISKEQARGGVAKLLADEGQESIVIGDHIDMKTADGSICVGWLASQTDMLAEDWNIVEQS